MTLAKAPPNSAACDLQVALCHSNKCVSGPDLTLPLQHKADTLQTDILASSKSGQLVRHLEGVMGVWHVHSTRPACCSPLNVALQVYTHSSNAPTSGIYITAALTSALACFQERFMTLVHGTTRARRLVDCDQDRETWLRWWAAAHSQQGKQHSSREPLCSGRSSSNT